MIKLIKFRSVLINFAPRALISFIILSCATNYWFEKINLYNRNIKIFIQPGLGSYQFRKILIKSHIASDSFLFNIYTIHFINSSEKLKSGYCFVPGRTVLGKITYMLFCGAQREIKFTITEGSDKYNIVNTINKNGLGNKNILQGIISSSLLLKDLKILNCASGGIEGYLFPETYLFKPEILSIDIFKRMHNELLNAVTPEMDVRIQQTGFSFHEILTLSSLVERETNSKFEKKAIASTLLNRLKYNMKLQTDPSVSYGVYLYLNKITKKDLYFKHRYNTYVYYGLPPGPIDSPGLNSINAVLWPVNTKFLYFVSKNGKTHEFCETYLCHLNAIKK